MSKRLTDEIAIQNIKEKCLEKDYEFIGFNTDSGKYEGKNSRVILKCNKCGKILNEIWYASIVANRNFHKCKREYNKETLKEAAIQRIKENLPSNFDFISIYGEFESCHKLKFNAKCKVCGEIFTYTYNQLMLYSKENMCCKNCHCSNVKLTNLIKSINDECMKKDLNFLGFKEKYFTSTQETHLILQCKKCGYIWNTTIVQNLFLKKLYCRKCKHFWSLEKEVSDLLSSNGIIYEEQKRFNWLGKQMIDIYIPSKKIAIECQGKQHFQSVSIYGGEKSFEIQQKRDIVKNKQCKENNVKLLYYTNSSIKEDEFLSEKLIKDKEELLNLIKNG